MKRRFFLIICILCNWFCLFADKSTDEYLLKLEQDKEAFRKLDTEKLWTELAFYENKVRGSKSNSAWGQMFTEESRKGAAINMVIEERSENGERDACYYSGLINLKLIGAYKKLPKSGLNSQTVKTLTEKVLKSLKTSYSKGGVRAAMALGSMYKDGYGVPESKFASADWYYKAAKIYYEAEMRDAALGALEKSLNQMPDHPKAKELMSKMFK